MAGAIGDETNLRGIGLAVGARMEAVEDCAERAHYIDVPPLGIAPDIVAPPRLAPLKHRSNTAWSART